ncbi:head-tail connector protein [Phyllobacterium leguminum]|uniref:Putative phiE125 gp8 family phage protein n=1 Tax=Phyllobacterium leguminum TaxID=314237 RepID=A0A318T2P0_9HYPH|nr:phage head-tail connector protein [Phyllobacterium leguminum]PYE86910.1 putative phiE125 gp8 family phage protein [Phyllobacterium leguminum]
MAMHLITPPAIEPVTVSELRSFLRVSPDEDDVLLTQIIRTAREAVEAQAGLALINQTWRLRLDRWPRSGRVALYRHPVREIVEVRAYAPGGMAFIIGTGERYLQGSRPQRLYLSPRADAHWFDGMEIDFLAGFGETAADVPDALKRAILMHIADNYKVHGSIGREVQPA